ncbi:putative zinc finger protein [Dirofilaria immitis]
MANFFLCYECGATFSIRNDFDEHILIHQAVSLCYQIYEFDKGGPASVKAKEENQHITIFKENNKPQAIKLSATFRKTSCDWSQKNMRKTTTSKRKLVDFPFSPDSSSKVFCLKQRKNFQNDAKTTKTNKAQDDSTTVTINSQATQSQIELKSAKKTNSTDILVTRLPVDVSGPIHINSLDSQMMNSQKVVELPKTDVSVATVTTSARVTITSSSSTFLTASAIRQNESATSATTPMLPKCLICDYRSSQGTDMVEHVVRVHKTSITNLERVDFVDGKWLEPIKLEPKQQCAYCVRTFQEVTDYFLHVIICHKRNLLLPNVSKYNCIVYLAHPGMPTHMVRIFMKRP